MRLEATDYHAIAADHPPDQRRASASCAQGRIGGLQNVAAEPPAPRATVVGDKLERGACGESAPLPRPQPDHLSLDRKPDDAVRRRSGTARCRPRGISRLCASRRAGRRWRGRSCAASRSCSSSRREAERRRRTTPSSWAAGRPGSRRRCTAPRRGCSTIVIEREAPGGQAGTSSRIENYLGFPSGVSGDELARRARCSRRSRLGAEILVTRSIERIDTGRRDASTSTAATSSRRRRSSSPAASPGDARDRRLRPAHGQGRLLRRLTRATRGTHGQDVHIVGAGNSAGPGGAPLREPRPQRHDPLPRARASGRACRTT